MTSTSFRPASIPPFKVPKHSPEALEQPLTRKTSETKHNDLLTLQWPSPPRNILLTKKNNTPHITESVIEFAKHIHSAYPGISIVGEPHTAAEIHGHVPFPVYSAPFLKSRAELLRLFQDKVDLVACLGGDGTILHASSLFATSRSVPPILSFSMGTLGFLGEWKFREYKRAFREVYMSGASVSAGYSPALIDEAVDAAELKASEPSCKDTTPHEQPASPQGWSSIRGKSLGKSRTARILLRNRLKVGVFDSSGQRIPGINGYSDDMYAMNEVLIHRGGDPHLSIIEVYIGGRFLTEAIADGMIISTPTGSTAYSLSSGGAIVHPLVASLLITPVCPRSLSFRPLVLPANTPITLRLSEKNRSHSVDVSVDGIRRNHGLKLGMEVRVWGEDIKDATGNWVGGVPSIVRGASGGVEMNGDDHWVGGLNGLLKFNYPFGEDYND
jgi:NADH kinase